MCAWNAAQAAAAHQQAPKTDRHTVGSTGGPVCFLSMSGSLCECGKFLCWILSSF